MFEKAARLKLRFVYRGVCAVEDLWDLPLEALDSIYQGLNLANMQSSEKSLLQTRNVGSDIIHLKLDIVTHIVKVRLLEQKIQEDTANKAAKRQKLLGIIAEKQDDTLRGSSIEELNKLIAEL